MEETEFALLVYKVNVFFSVLFAIVACAALLFSGPGQRMIEEEEVPDDLNCHTFLFVPTCSGNQNTSRGYWEVKRSPNIS